MSFVRTYYEQLFILYYKISQTYFVITENEIFKILILICLHSNLCQDVQNISSGKMKNVRNRQIRQQTIYCYYYFMVFFSASYSRLYRGSSHISMWQGEERADTFQLSIAFMVIGRFRGKSVLGHDTGGTVKKE